MTDGKMTIWQAARATSAATSFFDPITIGSGYAGRRYVDGALGFNNPLDEVWVEAQDIWAPDDGRLEHLVECIVSIGTGKPGTLAIGGDLLTIGKTLKDIATQTESTERVFAMKHRELFDPEQRYFRFNVDQGLETMGLEEYQRQGEIYDATARYLNDHELVRRQIRTCAINMSQENCMPISLVLQLV